MSLPSFQDILDELNKIQESKSRDYDGAAPLCNLRASVQFGIPPWLATMLRANDKMSRIANFARKGSLENEKVEDSLIDLAVYTIQALRLYREEKERK
jgi:hypothetical protein